MDSPLLVRQDGVALRWHEAVALVRGVVDALEDGRLRSVPPSGDLALEADGSLYITPHATSAAAPAQVVTQLRELLGDLLSSDAPDQLRSVAGQPVTTLAEFRQALAFFERPTLENDRRVLAQRLSAIQDGRHVDEEVERLRRKARTHEEDQSPAEKTSPAVRKRRSLRKPALAAAIVLGIGAGGAVAMFTAPAAVEGQPVQRAQVKSGTAEKGFIQKLRAAAAAAFGSPEAPAANAASSAKPSPASPRPAQRRRTPGPNRETPQSSGSPTANVPSVTFVDLRLVPPTRALPWTPPDLTLPLDLEFVFTRQDAGVAPPVLLRPHLPRLESIGLPSDRLGTVEVVVGEDGRVEQVRLVRTNAERRYYDAMILAAVKAWVFQPASRSGQPVRFRLQIPLT